MLKTTPLVLATAALSSTAALVVAGRPGFALRVELAGRAGGVIGVNLIGSVLNF